MTVGSSFWLDVWRGIGENLSVTFTKRGDFLTAKNDLCKQCRIARQYHTEILHKFVEE